MMMDDIREGQSRRNVIDVQKTGQCAVLVEPAPDRFRNVLPVSVVLGIAEEGPDLLQVLFELVFITVRQTKQMQVTAQHSRELVGQLPHQPLLE